MRPPVRPASSLLVAGALALAAAAATSGADAQTIIDNATVTVPPGNIPPGDLLVGTTGTGVLNIVTGGVVTTSNTDIGDSSTGNGTIKPWRIMSDHD